jgi:hypothetical protein
MRTGVHGKRLLIVDVSLIESGVEVTLSGAARTVFQISAFCVILRPAGEERSQAD